MNQDIKELIARLRIISGKRADHAYDDREAADLLEANATEIERLTDAYNCWESDFNDLLESKRWFEAENEKLAIEVSRLEGVVYILNCRVNELRRASELELQLDDKKALLAENEKLRAALFGDNGALKRMDIARGILTRNGGDWNLLNTDDIRKALAAVEQSEAGDSGHSPMCHMTIYRGVNGESPPIGVKCTCQPKGSPDARIPRR